MITAGAVQMDTRIKDTSGNLAAMERVARKAKQVEPELNLIVFPELVTTGYECQDALLSLSEDATGPTEARIAALCKDIGCCIAYGFVERDGDAVYNSAAFIDQSGVLCGVYRKVHLFDEEREIFTPGSCLPVFQTPLGRVGMLICWDLAFPEAARCLALDGAELLISCSAWEYPYAQNYLAATRARAYENFLPLIASNRIGQEFKNRFIGHSAIYAAGGAPLTLLAHEEQGVAIGRIDPVADQKRRENGFDFLAYRHSSAYEALKR